MNQDWIASPNNCHYSNDGKLSQVLASRKEDMEKQSGQLLEQLSLKHTTNLCFNSVTKNNYLVVMNKRYLGYWLFVLFLLIASLTFGQKKSDLTEGIRKFKLRNYEEALLDFLSYTEDTTRMTDEIRYYIGVCYLNSNIDKSKAVPYLEQIIEKDNFPELLFVIGRAYQFAYDFKKAIAAFNDFKLQQKGSDVNQRDVDRQIQHCLNALELTKYPLDVVFENLGPNINSPYADYFPFVPSTESFMVFNSKRGDGYSEKLPDGSLPSFVYYSDVEKGKFVKAKLMKDINTARKIYAAEVVGFSDREDMLLWYEVTAQGATGNLFVSAKDEYGTFTAPVLLDQQIHSDGHEIAACITNDGNQIYIASDKPGGFGGTDLYVYRKMPDGSWSKAKNLGPEINTADNEDFPTLSPDGTTLFFSSNGRSSMGGYDIFKAKWDDSSARFLGVKNLGFPINTVDDDMNFCLSKTGRHGYLASLRKGGLGDLDIYRVTYRDIDPQFSILLGTLKAIDSTQKVDYRSVKIWVNNGNSGRFFGEYHPNSHTGKYVIILPPGTYELCIDAEGYRTYRETMDVYDKKSFQSEVWKSVQLEK